MIRSKAESRSVVTNSRRPSPSAYDTRTLPSRRSGRGRSMSTHGATTSSLDMAHRRFEEAQPEVGRRRRIPPMVRVLAGHDVVLGVGHQAEHETGLVAHAGD